MGHPKPPQAPRLGAFSLGAYSQAVYSLIVYDFGFVIHGLGGFQSGGSLTLSKRFWVLSANTRKTSRKDVSRNCDCNMRRVRIELTTLGL